MSLWTWSVIALGVALVVAVFWRRHQARRRPPVPTAADYCNEPIDHRTDQVLAALDDALDRLERVTETLEQHRPAGGHRE